MRRTFLRAFDKLVEICLKLDKDLSEIKENYPHAAWRIEACEGRMSRVDNDLPRRFVHEPASPTTMARSFAAKLSFTLGPITP